MWCGLKSGPCAFPINEAWCIKTSIHKQTEVEQARICRWGYDIPEEWNPWSSMSLIKTTINRT